MTYIIAEAGINHNGDMSIAMRLIDEAAEAGADAVKFQLYKAELLTKNEKKLEILRKCQLSEEQIQKLKISCAHRKIEFLCTPFDKESADFLEPLVTKYKIGSGQAGDIEFLAHVSAKGKPMIISTAGLLFKDIRKLVTAVDVPYTLLHCVSKYPTPANKAKLYRMKDMMERLGVPIGYSDHTEGIDIALAAIALGATIIEKHLTLNKEMDGPDHKASITPEELAALVRGARNIDAALLRHEE